jgi:predicted PurR-regulated permease PerM
VLRNPWVRFLGALILLALAVRVVYVIRGVLIPFCLALVAAYIFDPVVDWLEARRFGGFRLGRRGSVALLVGGFLVVLGLIAGVGVPLAVNRAAESVQQEEVQNVFQRARQFLPEPAEAWLTEFEAADEKARRKMIFGLISGAFAEKGSALAAGESALAIGGGVLSVLLGVFQVFLFFIVTVYLLVDIDRARERVRGMLPLGHKDEIVRIARKVDLNLKAFFRGQVVVVLVLSCIFTVGLAIVDCPFWYIIGPAGGLGAFVPYFALASGMAPAVLVSLAAHRDPWHPLAAAAVFGVGLAIDNVFITPRIIGKRVGMHPVSVILSILVFGTLFGFLGVLFAVPFAAVTKVFAQELLARYRTSELYTGTPRESE